MNRQDDTPTAMPVTELTINLNIINVALPSTTTELTPRPHTLQ